MDTLQEWIRILADHREKPAVVALQKTGLTTRAFSQIVEQAQRLAAGLLGAGLQAGMHAVLFAPNRPEWLTTCVALFAAGAIPVPLDTQMSDEDLRHVLIDSEARWIFTTTHLARRLDALGLQDNNPLVLLDAEEHSQSWRHYLAEQARDLPSAKPDDLAVLFYTSGTTGKPKGVPLTHHNLTSNLDALLDLGLMQTDDRLLLPLPLHHVYPFTVGFLAPLATGIPIIFPHSLTGPQILRALREGRVTAILGVPRFYAALFEAMTSRLRQRGRLAAALFASALAVSVALRRRPGLRLGRWLFAPLHKQLAPHLRVVASGGSALDPQLAWKLEGLGWQVASGYGLTETSPILTFHAPGAGRLDTAGRPLPGVDLRIAQSEEHPEHGEILAKGPNVFSGYWHLPEETRKVFTADGYFRTGDLGSLDEDGYLRVLGRASTMIVLPGGENVRTEDVEETLAQAASIREAGVLEDQGRLVALLVPEPRAVHQDGQEGERVIRRDVEQQARTLPSHQRISDYAVTSTPLPRTRLGKLRRHQLTARYHEAKQQGARPAQETGPVPIEQLVPEDRQLLEDPVARQVWEWLARQFPQARLTPETHLQLDLDIDSLAWLNLTLEMREHTQIELDEEAIGRIETVRDLLREAAEAEHATGDGQDLLTQLQQPEALLSARQRQWLQPPSPAVRALGALLLQLDRVLMRGVYRLEVRGREHLPEQGPFIVAPNHVSLLDPLAVGAALPKEHLRRTYWGGWTGIMFSNPLMRLVSRATRVVPIDPQRGPLSSLAFAIAALRSGANLVWFPEGRRSQSGRLQRFRPGIGLVLSLQRVPVIPVHIAGTDKALPYGARWPRLHPLTVTFGPPIRPEELRRLSHSEQPQARITDALYERVSTLGAEQRL